jgi:hypothetical protein
MQVLACVYRHRTPEPRELKQTREAAKSDPRLARFLDGYQDSFHDWGDDPGFFAAEEHFGDVRRASWGVCRPDVRSRLELGDSVVFFCGRQTGRAWAYHFVGVGVVARLLDRKSLWDSPRLMTYRQFYNLLIDKAGSRFHHHEHFYKWHDNWEERAAAPYVLFDPEASAFNLVEPHEVARFDGRHVPERWHRYARSQELEELLFRERKIARRLRTSLTGYGHSSLNLSHAGGRTRRGRSPEALVTRLLELVGEPGAVPPGVEDPEIEPIGEEPAPSDPDIADVEPLGGFPARIRHGRGC